MHARRGRGRTPLHELPAPGPGVPRRPSRELGLELEQVLRERPLEAGERRLDAVGGVPERRLLRPASRERVSPAPALEQPAERERRRLARAELRDEARAVSSLARVALDDAAQPASDLDDDGKTIGRRRVRS
jgi:hypothetical protein